MFFDGYARDFRVLLLSSGFLGAMVGIMHAGWQVPVETAQVLTGLVRYDPGSLQYAYHAAVFSVLNYLAAVLLLITNSEVVASYVILAVLGAIAMQCMAMIIFLITRNVYTGVLGGWLVFEIHFYGSGISYPIILFGSPHAFGRAGHLVALYALLFFAFKRYKAALFLVGLSLAVHVPWGLWLNGCLLLVILWNGRSLRHQLNRAHASWYLAGTGFSLVLLAWHKVNYPVAPADATSVHETTELFRNFIAYWDHHRVRRGVWLGLTRELFYASITLVWAAIAARRWKHNAGDILFYRTLVVSTVISVVLVFVPSWFDPTAFPQAFVAMMPGRFINFSILIALPLLLGHLLRHAARPISLGFVGVGWLLITSLAARYGHVGSVGRPFGLLLVVVALSVLQKIGKWTSPVPPGPRVNQLLGLATLLLLIIVPAYVVHRAPYIAQSFPRLSLPSAGQSAVLTTIDRYLLQVEQRVPVITPMLDGYPYAGSDALERVDRFMEDLYGLTLKEPPPEGVQRNGGVIATADYSALWEARSCAAWEQLAAKYNFALVVVPAPLELKLPGGSVGDDWNAFHPKCPP